MEKCVAMMAGSIFKILVKPNDNIEEGQNIAIIESMKMEIPIISEVSGKVIKVNVDEGIFVNEGDVIAEIERQ